MVNNTLDTIYKRDRVHYDGVLGLGLFATNNAIGKPILTTALKQKAIDRTSYTIWLQRQNGGDCEESKYLLPVVGSLTLGDGNKNKCGDAASINWHPLRPSYGSKTVSGYTTQVDQVGYGDQVYTLDKKITWTARFAPEYGDVLFAPAFIGDDIAKRLGAKIQIDSNTGRYYPIDCKAKTPDDVKIVMDRKEYVIPGKHLIDRFYYPGTCALNIIAYELSPTDTSYQFIIGSPFLREYCQTYDAANNRIGFSKNTDPNEMDTQRVCSGATTLAGLSVIVAVTLFSVVAF
ncbi:aspartic protease [Aphelenchoides avenae]|nr:aspartic protease [Aphelenchus avenae]